LRRKIICPECGEYGRLEIQSSDKYRINHDKVSKGHKKPQRCYLGSLSKSLAKIKAVSEVRDDIIDPALLSELEASIKKERKEHWEEIENSAYGTLIARIIQLSQKLGSGWSSKSHHLVKQDFCPFCNQRIQHRFVRMGELKENRYNITQYGIEKGSAYRTSWMNH